MRARTGFQILEATAKTAVIVGLGIALRSCGANEINREFSKAKLYDDGRRAVATIHDPSKRAEAQDKCKDLFKLSEDTTADCHAAVYCRALGSAQGDLAQTAKNITLAEVNPYESCEPANRYNQSSGKWFIRAGNALMLLGLLSFLKKMYDLVKAHILDSEARAEEVGATRAGPRLPRDADDAQDVMAANRTLVTSATGLLAELRRLGGDADRFDRRLTGQTVEEQNLELSARIAEMARELRALGGDPTPFIRNLPTV